MSFVNPIAGGQVQLISDLVRQKEADFEAAGLKGKAIIMAYVADAPGMSEAGITPETDKRAFDGIQDVIWYEMVPGQGTVRKVAYGELNDKGEVVFGDFIAAGDGTNNFIGDEYDFDGDGKADIYSSGMTRRTFEWVDEQGNPDPNGDTEKWYDIGQPGDRMVTISGPVPKKPQTEQPDINKDGLLDTIWFGDEWYIHTISPHTIDQFKLSK